MSRFAAATVLLCENAREARYVVDQLTCDWPDFSVSQDQERVLTDIGTESIEWTLGYVPDYEGRFA